MDRRIVMVACGIAGVVSCLAMSVSIASSPPVLYALAACIGTVLFPIYALNVAHANDLARPDEYVEISSGLMITYGLGTISGPLMVGPVMDRFGPVALFIALAVYFALYSGYAHGASFSASSMTASWRRPISRRPRYCRPPVLTSPVRSRSRTQANSSRTIPFLPGSNAPSSTSLYPCGVTCLRAPLRSSPSRCSR